MSRITRNIVYNGLGQVASLLLGFVAVRFVFRRLGGDALGLIYFAQTLSVTLTVGLQLGICETAVREVASHYGKKPEYLTRFIRTSSLLYWGAFLFLEVLAHALAPYLIRHWVNLDSLNVETATRMLRILCFGTLLALPRGLYAALVGGLERMEFRNAIDVSARALQQFGIFAILYFHGSVFQVAYWISGCFIAQLAAHMVVCAQFFPIRAMIPDFHLDVVKQNVGYASGLMTITVCAWAFTQGDRVILSKLVPLAVLGIYSFVRSATGAGMLLTGAINNAIFPHFSRLHGAGDPVGLKATYHKIHDLLCYATVPIFAAGPFVAIPVLSRTFDMPSAHQLLLPLTFLCLGYYMNGTLTTPYVLQLAMGRSDIGARQNFYALFVVLPLTVTAIYFFGLNGAGFSWVIYHIFAYSYGIPRTCRECLGEPVWPWFAQVFKMMGAAFLTYGGAWLVRSMADSYSIPWLAGTFAVATIVYALAAYRTMGSEARQTIIAFATLRRLKPKEVLVAE